jgi:Protein of unknown function (DUF2971)
MAAAPSVPHPDFPNAQLGACLYHFTRADVASLILDQNSVRMSPFENTNDPREAKDWFVTPVSATSGFDPALFQDTQEALNIRLKRETKVTCFSVDGEPKGNRDEEPLERGWAHPRMWAHYGDNHHGVCLVFDKPRLEEAFRQELEHRGELDAGNVAYSDMNPALTRAFVMNMTEVSALGVDAAIDAHAAQNVGTLLFTKLSDWATEMEYRFVLRGRDASFEFVDLCDTLLAACVGTDYPDSDGSGVLARLRTRSVPTFRVQWINGHPSLVALP